MPVIGHLLGVMFAFLAYFSILLTFSEISGCYHFIFRLVDAVQNCSKITLLTAAFNNFFLSKCIFAVIYAYSVATQNEFQHSDWVMISRGDGVMHLAAIFWQI